MEKDTLKDFCKRIGLQLPPNRFAPSLGTLQVLQAHHSRNIPFENFNPLLGLPVNLEAEAIRQKLIYAGRGGYCYEQNLLFSEVLKTLGFEVVGLAARVLTGKENTVLPRTHMLLLVNIDKTYIVDVGFGGLTPAAPLLLEPERIQHASGEAYRLKYAGDVYTLQVKVLEKWRPLYSFDRQEQYRVDYKVANWYVSNHPDSAFVKCLMVARKAENGRFTLNNNRFTTYNQDGTFQRRRIDTVEALMHILKEVFDLHISGLPGIGARLKQLIDFENQKDSDK